jgi:hypothetical protein
MLLRRFLPCASLFALAAFPIAFADVPGIGPKEATAVWSSLS